MKYSNITNISTNILAKILLNCIIFLLKYYCIAINILIYIQIFKYYKYIHKIYLPKCFIFINILTEILLNCIIFIDILIYIEIFKFTNISTNILVKILLNCIIFINILAELVSNIINISTNILAEMLLKYS